MAIVPGTRLGPYDITGAIGAGGMGEVYRARDRRLGRDVAIKLLPELLATDQERRAQFEHEAHVLASLNHSHIAQVYGFEEVPTATGGTLLVLAMELVEGETLADRIARGALDVDEASVLLRHVAAALEAAHARGIVHRDLKPSNIKITPDGQAKVLDFGIASRVESDAADATVTTPATAEVRTHGTPLYMSPEQIRGRPIDKRADIWAFGCCLYEALTGRKPFAGTTLAEIFTAILTQEPDWSALPAPTTPSLRRLLRHCLQKDPERRLRDAGDAWIEDVDPAQPGRSESRRPIRAILLGALPWALAALSAVAVLTLAGSTTRTGRPVRHLSVVLPESAPLALASWAPVGEGRPAVALSPNGDVLVYVGLKDGSPVLYERHLDRPDFAVIPGTAGAFNPFFSPDGRWVGFFAQDQLKKADLRAHETVTLCPASNAYGAAWSPDGTIFFSAAFGRVLMRVPENGGPPVEFARSATESYSWPEILPGGTTLLAGRVGQGIVAISVQSGKESPVLGSATHAKYAPSGHLVYGQDGALYAAAFDPDRAAITGTPIAVVGSVRTESRGAAQFSIARDGTLVYVPGASAAAGTFVRVDREGKEAPLGFPTATYGAFQVAPDGRRLVAVVEGSADDLWIFDLERRARTRLTFEGNNTYPIWTPDARWILFASDRTGVQNMFRTRADGTGQTERLLAAPNPQRPYSVSRDGKWLVFSDMTPGGTDIAALALRDGAFTRLVHARFQGSLMMLSPDGQWLAYTSDDSGRSEVYLRDFPDANERLQVSTDGGEEPVWSPAGNELFYRNGQEWMAVPVAGATPLPEVGAPRPIFHGDYLNVPGRSYDVMPDGRSFILIRRMPEPVPTRLNVVLSWFEELRQTVGAPR